MPPLFESLWTGLAAGGAYVVDRALRNCVRLRVDDPAGLLARARGGAPCIFACRHGQLVPLLWVTERCGLTILVSASRDGELLARVLERRGFALIRGSSSHSGRTAAQAVLRALQAGAAVGLAVDGPRGPRGLVQDGVLRLAQSSQVPIVPLVAHARRAWVAARSWDRFEVPHPGTHIAVGVGPAVLVEAGAAGLARAGAQVALALGGWRTSQPPLAVPVGAQPLAAVHGERALRSSRAALALLQDPRSAP